MNDMIYICNSRSISFVLILVSIVSVSCTNSIENKDNAPKVAPPKENKTSKVIFFLENSESMFGYVNGHTEYVDVVTELAQKPLFVQEEIGTEYYLINGRNPLSINFLGADPKVLRSNLSPTGYRRGDISKSDLNSMFQVALERAQNDIISILISDAIFDIGQKSNPLTALATEGRETRSKFITRLKTGDLQTLMIKVNSDFKGIYFFTSQTKSVLISHKRPFYIWVFGKSELLNKYFPEEYLSQHLKGFDSYARFLVLNEKSIPYQIAPSKNKKGSFRADHNDNHKLSEALALHGVFQFAFAVDYSSLPYSNDYLASIKNYDCPNSNFTVVKVEKIAKKIPGVKGTHLITVSSNKNLVGDLEIVLKNQSPNWIKDTDIATESHLDTTHTFGFKFLTDAISEAYEFKSKGKNLASFKIVISN